LNNFYFFVEDCKNLNIFRLSLAVDECRAGKLSLRASAETYGVKKSTIAYHLKNPEAKIGKGLAPKLTEVEEKEIVNWAIGSLQRGVPRCSLDLIEAANKLLKRRPSNRVVGRGWLRKFILRHKFSSRIPDNLTQASSTISKSDIRNWFRLISEHINNDPELLNAICDKKRVFNCDETMMRLNSEMSRVLAPTGTRHVYRAVKDDKAGLTVMCTLRADGKSMKPFIIYPHLCLLSSNNGFKCACPTHDASRGNGESCEKVDDIMSYITNKPELRAIELKHPYSNAISTIYHTALNINNPHDERTDPAKSNKRFSLGGFFYEYLSS
jgi:Tc5 transposase DNA-binding domain